MTRRILLDANILIAAFDGEGDTAQESRIEAIERMETLVLDPEVKLVITPLIPYEVLRGVRHDDSTRADELAGILDRFDTLDVTDEVSDLATRLFRLDRHECRSKDDVAIDKRRFDVFHFATAMSYGLELDSMDAGTASLRALHDRPCSSDLKPTAQATGPDDSATIASPPHDTPAEPAP